MKLKSLISLARPSHWIKNVVVLLPILFGMRYDDAAQWQHILTAGALFCLASSMIYIFNDIRDLQTDRLHPTKQFRPLASGQCSVRQAVIEMIVIAATACAIALVIPKMVLAVIVAYVLLQLLYSLVLKDFVLVDVICISLGFVLRAVCGAVAIDVEISPWLFICLFTIFLFMGFCKRYNEIVVIGDTHKAVSHRQTLLSYTPELLTHLITTSAGIAIVAFLSYSLHAATVERFGSDYLVYTLPVIVYAIFRFAMLSMKGVYAGPTEILIKDKPFQAAAGIWLACAAVVILYGPAIKNYLSSL